MYMYMTLRVIFWFVSFLHLSMIFVCITFVLDCAFKLFKLYLENRVFGGSVLISMFYVLVAPIVESTVLAIASLLAMTSHL